MPLEPTLLRALFETVAAALCAVDADGRLTAMNPRAEDLLDRPEATAVGADLHDILHLSEDGRPLPRESCALLAVLREGRAADGDEVLTLGGGRRAVVTWSGAPIVLDGTLTGAVFALRDSSSERKAEAEHRVAMAAAQAANHRLALLSEATALLGGTLDLRQALQRLADIVVPYLGDWSVVDLLEEPDQVRRAAVAHTDTGTNAKRLVGPLPRLVDTSSPLGRALRHGETLVLGPPQLQAEPQSDLHAAQLQLFRRFGAQSAVVAPLRARGRVLGALTIVRLTGAMPYSDDEVALVNELASRAAVAVDNARMYQLERGAAELLQRAVLAELPALNGFTIGTRYVPATETRRVGGDWYDAFPLPSGDVAVVVGDVEGHDLQAAARMGQLRNLVRAIAVDSGADPADVLSRVDAVVRHLGIADLATVVLLTARTTGSRVELSWSNSGHPPPVLLTPDGRARLLDGDPDVVLGLDAQRTNHHLSAPSGSTLVLYTDGLIEQRDRSIDEGLHALLATVERHSSVPPEALCDVLLDDVCEAEDDVVVVVVRLA